MHKNLIPDDERPERGYLFCKGRGRGSGVGEVLIAVPWTRDAAIDNFAFSQWPILVLADIGDGGYAAVIFEDGDPLAPA